MEGVFVLPLMYLVKELIVESVAIIELLNVQQQNVHYDSLKNKDLSIENEQIKLMLIFNSFKYLTDLCI